jgi:phosphonoacetaldehyde hydrolase
MAVRAILFDVIGTTVLERENDLIIRCFRHAFRDHSIEASPEQIQSIRGRDKNAAIISLLIELHAPAELSASILESFKQHFSACVNLFYENADLKALITFLRSRQILIGVGSGLPEDIFMQLFDYLHWQDYQFDYIGISEKIGKGRPDPAMIFDMMSQLGIHQRELIKVGDTPSDVSEGKNANVKTVALLSGTCSPQQIELTKPNHIIFKLGDLRALLENDAFQ